MEREKIKEYSCDHEYLAEWKKLLTFSGNLNQGHSVINIEPFGKIDISHLKIILFVLGMMHLT